MGREGYRPRGKPEAVGELLPRMLRQSGLHRRLANLDLEMAWADIAAENNVGKSRIESIRNGVLVVGIASHSRKYELENFQRDAIIKGLNAVLGRDKIRELRFKTATFPEPTSRKELDGTGQGREEEAGGP